MKYRMTIIDANGRRSRSVIGNRDQLLDAAYDGGALGVTIVAE